MGDLHFILRHALTGAVLIGFLVAGLWSSAPDQAVRLISYINRASSSGVPALILSLIASVPILGVVIQGLHVMFLIIGKQLFTDPARSMMARAVRKAYMNDTDQTLNLADWSRNSELLNSSPDDSLYVWVYHTIAPTHLIDWARRRRSYYYLGINLSIAAGLGATAGYALGVTISGTNDYLPYPIYATWVGAAVIVWIGCATWLALVMKKDVEAMELAWTCGELNPTFKGAVCQGLKPKDKS